MKSGRRLEQKRVLGERRGQGRGGAQHRFLDGCKDELQVPCAALDNFAKCPSQQNTLHEDCLEERDQRKQNRSQRQVKAVEGASTGGRG